MEAIQAWAQSVWEQIDFNLIQGDRYLMMLDGLKVTLQISVAAAVIGVLLGSFIALMRLSNARIGKWYFLRSIATSLLYTTPSPRDTTSSRIPS